MQHCFFANIDWLKLSQKCYKAPFVPTDVLKAKFAKENNRLPTEEDDEYVYDTRFFSPK